MAVYNIYHKDGSQLKDSNGKGITVHSIEYNGTWMGECFVTVTFENEAPISFSIGDYIEYRGERFEINYDPGKIKCASKDSYGGAFKYDSVKFNALSDELVRCDMLDLVLYDNQLHYTALPQFSFYVESLDDLLDRIQANLDELYGKASWKLYSRNKQRSVQRGGLEIEWNSIYGDGTADNVIDSTSISISDQTCWDALSLVNSQFDVNFIVRNRNVYVGTEGMPTTNIFKYGKDKGLYEIEQNSESDQAIVTRLRAYGSNRNLPNHYYADLGGIPFLNITGDYHTGSTENGLSVMMEDSTYAGMFTDIISDNGSNMKHCRIRGSIDGYEFDGTLELVKKDSLKSTTRLLAEGKEVCDVIKAKIDTGIVEVDFIRGANKSKFDGSRINYVSNLPNNMACDRLMLPGFPNKTLREWWDAQTAEKKAWLNPSGKEHIFSNDIYRPYVDSMNIEKIGVRPSSAFFDQDDKTNGIIEIYPTIEEMEVDGVRVDEIYTGTNIEDDGRFGDGETVANVDIYLSPKINFDIRGLMQDDFTIHMKDGMCAGREFKVAGCTKQNDGSWRLTIERKSDDSLNLYFPYNDFQIKKGDHFVLSGIELPDAYVEAASEKLLKYCIAYLDKNDYTRYVYQPKVDEIFMARQHDKAMADASGLTKSLYLTLKEGDIMLFKDDDLGIDGEVTIDQLTIKEEDGKIPTYEITLRDEKEVSTIQKIQNQISSITSGNGGSFSGGTGGGGLSSSQIKNLIDAIGSDRFLSKLNPDTAAGIITFLQGTNWGSFTSETGAAMTVDPTTGQTYMEVDRLKVRLKAFFEQLEVQKVGYVGGKLIVTKGQGVDILDVEEVFDSEGNLSAYRCYFLGEQEGRKIDNLLRVGDQMICKDCNISEGSTDGATNKYYWRLATAVSSDVVKRGNNVCHWVDLSATDYDTGSDVPLVGDTICHLGNRNDIDRQGAEVLSVVDANSPSFTIYAGINSYSLVDKEHIDMGVSGGKAFCNIYGSTYIGDRERNTGYLRWNDDTKTFEIKGTIDISSPLSSGGTIGGAISSAANAYKDDFSALTSNVNKVIGEFQAQIDGVIETWFYDPEPTLGNLPASEWKDNDTRDKHLGDLYYSKAGKAYRFQKEGDNYVWVEIMDTDITKALEEAKAAKDAAAAAQGTADTAQNTANSKMKVFVVQPTNNDEYSVGDMWVNATYPADGSTYNNEILHCVTAKAAGKAFSITHWAQSSNIKTQFNNFVNNTYADDKKDFYNQLDGKVETWYQSADPKDSWATADYSKHTGDIWYNGSTNKAYRWTGTAWVELKDQAAIDAKALAESKRRVFTTTTLPTPPYDAKDLWVQGENGDIMVCVTPKAAGTTASASDWVKASKYTDDTAANAAQTTANNAAAAAQGINNAINAIDGNVNVALKDKIITKTEAAAITEALNSLSAIMSDVTKTYEELVNNVVYQLISSDVRTNYNSTYTTLDTAYNELSDYINNTLLKVNPITDNILSTYNTKYSNFKEKYEAYVSKLTVVRNSMDAKLNTRIGDLAAMLGGLKATTDAMDETTQINGGLILSTLLALGYTDSNKVFNVMSGVSGLYENKKGGGIAFWAGGHRIDKQVEPNNDKAASYVVRQDGTGYAAKGNLWWDDDGRIHADPQSFLINEQYVGNVMQLFKFVYSGGTAFENIVHAIPQKPFESLSVGANGLTLYNGENTAKLYIKNGVLFIDGDLAVTGGITMYASDGIKSGMIDQVYAVLDQSLFSKSNDETYITITGEIGSGTVKGITINSTKYDPDTNGIIALALNWGDLTGVPTTFTPSAHTHDDRYYIKSEIDTKLSGKSDTGHTHDDRYYTESEIDTKLGLKLDTSLKGTANGIATLDASGKVPSAQLPSYVDDVLEYANKASFPATGEAGKIYIDQTTNLTYRWGGTAYVEISQSLALGETSSTAYAGDKGKQNAADIAALKTGKADKATTLAGYGITDAYTKTETYTKTEVNTKLTDGSVTKIGTADVGSTTKPIYLKAGVPTAVGTSLAVDITGNSATTSKLKTAVTLWGQSFDGSKAITGNLSDVGTITPTGEDLKVVGNLIVTGGIVMYADDGATIESGFAALLAAHIDGVTIKYNSTEQKIYSVMSGIEVNGKTFKPNDTTGIITLDDYPTSLDWSKIENKPDTFTPSSHTHTFASLTSKPTTIAGYGITDAKIVNGVITLGTATITPLTAHQTVTLASGTNNGTLKLTVNGTATDNIAVKGLGSAAYTEASAYAAASHTHSYLPLAGGTMTGVITSSFASNTWINGVTNAIIKATYTGYGAILSMPVNGGRVSLSSYPSIDNFIYFGYASSAQISAGTNSFTKQMRWDAASNNLYADTFTGALAGNASTASKWATARKITLTGSVTGEVSIDGSGNVSLATTTNHTHSYVPLSGGTMTGSLILKGATSADMTYAGNAHPSIRFDNSDSSQNVSLIFTDYDAYRAPAGLKLVGNQGNEWFEAADIYATTFHGALSGNASTASKLGTSNVGSGTQHFYLSSGTATASTSNVGGTAKPMYLKAGVMTAISATVGGTAKPVFLNAGTLTAISATVGSASKPVYLSGGSITACSYDFTSYLPLAGGTMGGTAWIVWPDSGNWGNSNSGVTFPVTRGGLHWIGQSDWVKLFSQETGNDNLNLVLQFGDDNSNGLSIRNNGGSQTAFIAATGHITAANTTVNGTLKVGAIPVTNSSTGILKIDGDLIVTGGITMYATDGVSSGFKDLLGGYIDNDTIKQDETTGKLYANISVIGGGTVKGATVGGTAVTLDSATGILQFPAYPTATNKAVTLAWNTTSTIATVAGTDITVKLPANPNTDTKNTAGSTDTSSKIFLVGATSQAANPQTYSHDTAYVGTDGCLYSGGTKVSVSGHTHSYLPLSGGTLTNNLTIQTGGIWVQGGSAAGSDNTRMSLVSGMPDGLAYNTSKRGVRIYSNAIAFADPYNGNSNNDSGWIRHLETTANSGILEIATGDDGAKSIVVRKYNTSSAVVKEAYLLNSSGNTSFPGTVSASGFVKSGSSDSYVLLGGGGHKAVSDFATSGHTHSYLPLSGGTMTGNITYNAKGTSYIGNGANDAAHGLGGALNNLVISSWFGVSFTTSCGGQTYTGTNAVSINCRNGYVYANTFVGALSGNASTATKLTSSAGSATLPIYFSDGKPVACTAASVFSNLTNSGNNISVTVAGQNRTLTVGYASTSSKVVSRGNLTAYEEGATTMGESGINLYTVYKNGYPVTYGNLIHIYGSGAGQLLAEWCGSSILGHLYYRSKRDNTSNGWSAWGKVAFTTDTVANSDTCDGLHVHSGRNNEANKIVRTDGNGYIQCGYIHSSSGNEGNNSSPARVWGTNGSDSYMRTYLTSALAVATSGSVRSDAGNKTTGLQYYSGSGFTKDGTGVGGAWSVPSDSNDAQYSCGQAIRMWWASAYYTDILSGPNSWGATKGLYIRQIVNGAISTGTFTGGWRLLLDSSNYNRYVPTLTGTGASGTWGISISGNAATASKWATARTLTLSGSVKGSVSIDGSGNVTLTTTTNHTHSYLPLSGGTMTGTINANDNVQNTGIKFKSNNANLNALNDQHLILGKAIRFGAYNTWDWNVWAGLKYDSSSKTIYLGLADGTTFNANSAQSGGTIKCPGVEIMSVGQNAGVDKGFRVTGSNYTMDFMIGSGNVNRGIYDRTAGQWMLYFNDNSTQLPKGNVVVSHHLWLNKQNASSSVSGASQLIFGLNGTQHIVISSNKNAIILNPSTTSTTEQTILTIGASNTSSFAGNIKAGGGITMYSDLRKKNILSDEVLSVKEIAAAPLFAHTYKSDENHYLHIGTSAQYWSAIHEGWFTRKDSDGYYQMELQNLGVAMGISLAREIVTFEGAFKKYESKTDKKIKLMKKKINDLETANKALDARIKELEGSMEERRTA